MLTISPEEAEELAFVASALSEPRVSIYFCDDHCSEKSVRYWQFASVVFEEGGEARTVNLCQQCYGERRVQQVEPSLNSWQWRDSFKQGNEDERPDAVQKLWSWM